MKSIYQSDEERFEAINECRSSGLSDYQWCIEHGIKPSTFYSWIAKFRRKGYPNIPEPLGRKSKHKANLQEVVKLEVLPDEQEILPRCNNNIEQNACFSTDTTYGDPVIEICTNNSVIRVTNSINPQLLAIVLNQIGGIK